MRDNDRTENFFGTVVIDGHGTTEREFAFRPSEELIFNERNRSAVYSVQDIRLGNHDTDRGHYFR